jgi:hypothetical protein
MIIVVFDQPVYDQKAGKEDGECQPSFPVLFNYMPRLFHAWMLLNTGCTILVAEFPEIKPLV